MICIWSLRCIGNKENLQWKRRIINNFWTSPSTVFAIGFSNFSQKLAFSMLFYFFSQKFLSRNVPVSIYCI